MAAYYKFPWTDVDVVVPATNRLCDTRVNTRSSLPVSIETKAPLDLDGRKVESNGRRKFSWILDFVEVDRDS